MNTKPQAEINMVLAAGAPETETKHGHKGFGSVSAESGLCVGATSKPILFSAPMVKAILSGRKTQTRRIVKAGFDCNEMEFYGLRDYDDRKVGLQAFFVDESKMPLGVKCPYGKVGDTLWVRETWWKKPFLTRKDLKDGADTWPDFEYETEKIMAWEDSELKHYGWKKMPSIFMPREACRIKLTITGIRVERLNSITNEDAFKEGIDWKIKFPEEEPTTKFYRDYERGENCFAHGILFEARHSFFSLWKSINGRESYNSNPFVWVIEFSKNGI